MVRSLSHAFCVAFQQRARYLEPFQSMPPSSVMIQKGSCLSRRFSSLTCCSLSSYPHITFTCETSPAAQIPSNEESQTVLRSRRLALCRRLETANDVERILGLWGPRGVVTAQICRLSAGMLASICSWSIPSRAVSTRVCHTQIPPICVSIQ